MVIAILFSAGSKERALERDANSALSEVMIDPTAS